MKNLNKYLPWAVAIAAAFFLFFKSCNNKPQDRVLVSKVSDTVYVTKVVKVPAIKQVFITKKPKPTTETVTSNDTIRTYLNKYTDSTGVAEITVKDSLKGKLLNQIVSFHVKEREIQYKEKTITNTVTIKQRPKFSLALGLNTAIGVNSNIGAGATIKNGNGWSLDLGYNTNQQVLIGFKKDIITLYDKNGKN